MAPRVVRPRGDQPYWLAAAAAGAAALVLGFAGASHVFKPSAAVQPAAEDEGEAQGAADESGEPGDAGAQGTASAQAGAADAGSVVASTPVALPPPRVGVRVVRSVVQSCGDGEELTTPGERCAAVPGLDEALARYLAQLGNCPAAEQAARNPEATLSLGLRVDFARHRVNALPGRSSSVRDPLTYVACARGVLEHVDELWRLSAPHPRYLFFYFVRFGGAGGLASSTPDAATADAQATEPATEPGTPSGAGAASTAGATGAAGAQGTVATPSAGQAAGGVNAQGTTGATPTANAGDTSATPAAPVEGYPLRSPEPATVVWERVVVRDAPRTGAVVGRLAQGASVSVVARLGSWWRVRYGGGEGWVYGQAIGR